MSVKDKIELGIDIGQFAFLAFPIQLVLFAVMVTEYVNTRSFPLWMPQAFADLQIATTIGFFCLAINMIRSHRGI